MFSTLRSHIGINATDSVRRTSRQSASHRACSLRIEPLEVRLLLALVPELVADINLGSADSRVDGLTNVSGTLFFSTYDSEHGGGLWETDGTELGTQLVKNIAPGNLTNVNGTLFFGAYDAEHGGELWKSDGTEVGTLLVKDVNLGAGSSNPAALGSGLTNMSETLFFGAYEPEHGYEFWKSNGTEAGTQLLKDVNPGVGWSNPSASGGGRSNLSGTLFFSAHDPEHGGELWKSDGTEAGTQLVKDIWPGIGCACTGDHTDLNGTLFFRARDPVHGYDLWKSDGTEEGTQSLRDIWPGTKWSNPRGLTNVNGTLFFAAFNDEIVFGLWKSNGTEAGTQLVRDVRFNVGFGYSGPVFTGVDGEVFFLASDSEHDLELWKSDGTEAGTKLVRDINPVGSSNATSYSGGLTNVNGTLFFFAYDPEHGRELWSSDGTEAGTRLVHDIRSGTDGAYPGHLTNVNGTLYFTADDGIHGRELWKLPPMLGDTNYDGLVDITDLNNVRNNFGYTGDERPGDTTGDGVVGLDDLNAVRNHFGEGTPAASRHGDKPLAEKPTLPAALEVRREPFGKHFVQTSTKLAAVDLLFAREADASTAVFKTRPMKRIASLTAPR